MKTVPGAKTFVDHCFIEHSRELKSLKEACPPNWPHRYISGDPKPLRTGSIPAHSLSTSETVSVPLLGRPRQSLHHSVCRVGHMTHSAGHPGSSRFPKHPRSQGTPPGTGTSVLFPDVEAPLLLTAVIPLHSGPPQGLKFPL